MVVAAPLTIEMKAKTITVQTRPTQKPTRAPTHGTDCEGTVMFIDDQCMEEDRMKYDTYDLCLNLGWQ